MEKTSVQFRGFSDKEHIQIHGTTLGDVAHQYGRSVKELTGSVLEEKLAIFHSEKILQDSQRLLERTQRLAADEAFTVGDKPVLARYLTMLSEFARGAGISAVEAVFLQSHADVGCQTIVVRDLEKKITNFLHIEENDEDWRLVELYRKAASVSSERTGKERLYRYRLTTWYSPEGNFCFFSYPGLVGPGPAFGMNLDADTVIMADTLMPWQNRTDCVLWANAYAFMMADIGDIALARNFFHRLMNKDISLLGGYAVHMVGREEAFSSEWSADRMAITDAQIEGTRSFVAQTNYPHSARLREVDLFDHESPSIIDKQAALMVKRRGRRLAETAARQILPTPNPQADLHALIRLIADNHGDIETFDYGPVENGLRNPTAAAYIVGSVGPHKSAVLIGKMSPTPTKEKDYPLFHTRKSLKRTLPVSSVNLVAEVVDTLLGAPQKLTVAVVYSGPSSRSVGTAYAATDDDTAYVAEKVREALLVRDVRVIMKAVSEDTMETLNDLQTDVIFNLIEWTGKDIDLSKRAFAIYRKLALPVTGATERNFMETTDKIVAKALFLKHGIPTPKSQAFYTGDEQIVSDLPYPLIVKPSQEHGSIGLTRAAVVDNAASLRAAVKKQLNDHDQPVLAEAFISGRELLVYLLEKDHHLVVLPIEEICFSNDTSLTFQTYESKWDSRHTDFANTTVKIADLSSRERREVENVAKRVFRALGFRGYGRIDIRLRDGVPYVLEANANPNIYDSDEDQIPGISFPDFVWEVVASALREYKNGWKI